MTFRALNDETLPAASAQIAAELGASEEEMSDLLSGFADPNGEVEYAVAAKFGCVLIRIQDFGRYSFLYPYPFCENSDALAAVEFVAEYAMREDIPLVFCDVPSEEIGVFSSLGFRHFNLDAEDEECSGFRVEIKSECEIADEVPTVSDGTLELSALNADDITAYAEISRDPSSIKYWGYDYRKDAPNADDEYFFNTASRDFLAGCSLTEGIRLDGRLIGEAQLYAFDRRGAAEFAIRILPEYRRRGFGGAALELLFEAARRIGLVALRCDVMMENKPSLALIGKKMERVAELDGVVKFFARLS